MSYSHTVTETTTFTITDARHMASKVSADLKRMQRFYGWPSDVQIADYEQEVVELLKAGYLRTITYGFQRGGNWIEPALRYTARDLAGAAANDDDPGRVKPGADISGAIFYNFLTYSSLWLTLTDAQRDAFERRMPFRRTTGNEPGISGYLEADRSYSAGGRALDRTSVRNYR
jgi:hypothetical protein